MFNNEAICRRASMFIWPWLQLHSCQSTLLGVFKLLISHCECVVLCQLLSIAVTMSFSDYLNVLIYQCKFLNSKTFLLLCSQPYGFNRHIPGKQYWQAAFFVFHIAGCHSQYQTSFMYGQRCPTDKHILQTTWADGCPHTHVSPAGDLHWENAPKDKKKSHPNLT